MSKWPKEWTESIENHEFAVNIKNSDGEIDTNYVRILGQGVASQLLTILDETGALKDPPKPIEGQVCCECKVYSNWMPGVAERIHLDDCKSKPKKYWSVRGVD